MSDVMLPLKFESLPLPRVAGIPLPRVEGVALESVFTNPESAS